MLLRIDHETKLSYTEPVTESVIEIRTAPAATEDQSVLAYRLQVTPDVGVVSYRDGFGNRVELFNVFASHSAIIALATSFVRTHRRPAEERLAGVPFPINPPDNVELMEFLRPSELIRGGERVRSFVATLSTLPDRLVNVFPALWEAVHAHLSYEKKVTTANTVVEEALELGRGVCQDFAHLFLAACRAVGLPARYVSGYINEPGEIATHAWCQVWCGPTAGWVDADPTRQCWVDDDYVQIAHGRDYADVPPNRGVWKGTAIETIAVAVTVTPVDRVPAGWGEPSPTRAGPMQPQQQGRGRAIALNRQRDYRQQQSQQQQ